MCSDLKTEEGKWKYRGRPLEKSFLYDIVSNSIDSVDVDKFDYLLRDSHHAAIAIPFNQVADSIAWFLLKLGRSLCFRFSIFLTSGF